MNFIEWINEKNIKDLESIGCLLIENKNIFLEEDNTASQLLSSFQNQLPNIQKQAQSQLIQISNQIKQFPNQAEAILTQAKLEKESQVKNVMSKLKSSSSDIGGIAAQGANWVF